MDYMQIQLRNDTAAAWTAANPVLARGELGVEIDTFKVKMGDGALPWNDLPYLRGTGTGGAEVDWGDIVGSISSNAALTEALSGKVDAVVGKGLSTEDYTAEEREKLAGLPDDLSGYQAKSEKGKANGYAPLGPDGMLPESMYMRGGDGETYLETAFRVAMVAASSVTVDPSVVNGVAVGNVIAAGDTIKVAGEKYTVAGVSAVGTVTTIALEEAPATSVVGESIRVMARGNIVPLASRTVPGLAKRATPAEVAAGTNDTAFVSPLLLPRDFGRISVGGTILQADALNALFEIEAGDGMSISVSGKKITFAAGSNVNPDVDMALSTWANASGTSNTARYKIVDMAYSDYHNFPVVVASTSTSALTSCRLQNLRDNSIINQMGSYPMNGIGFNSSSGYMLAVGESRYSYFDNALAALTTTGAMSFTFWGACFAPNASRWIAVGANGIVSYAPYSTSAVIGWVNSAAGSVTFYDCAYIPWLGKVLAVGFNVGVLIDPNDMTFTTLTVPTGQWGRITLDDVRHRVILTPPSKVATTSNDFCWTADFTNWNLVNNLYRLYLGTYSPQMDALVCGTGAPGNNNVTVSYGLAPMVLKNITTTGGLAFYGGAMYDKVERCFYAEIALGSAGAYSYKSLAYNP